MSANPETICEQMIARGWLGRDGDWHEYSDAQIAERTGLTVDEIDGVRTALAAINNEDDNTFQPPAGSWSGWSPRTVCRSGRHKLTADTVYVRPSGTRECLACRREWQERALEKKRQRRAQPGSTIIDEIAVERRAEGENVPLTNAEMAAARAVLEAKGMSTSEIAERLHLTRRTITRHRAKGGRAA